uniref:Sec-independent protein translocase component TatC n=1 Tax=Platysiphonia delicata TaxID=2006979 RepID=A0A1Z1M0I1_9FLOR|nr:Sec-independent protein translocase component TatC [Platysiphonia delicata]ARW59597.1 Sec-independent protein translocase component TatC [Platysiphonia delicata]
MRKIYKLSNSSNMSFVEHLEELRKRFLSVFIIFCTTTIICLINTKTISLLLQKPALGVKFLQLAPGEYIFVSIKIACCTGIILSSPFAIYQIVLFILPGLTDKEASNIIPILTISVVLFFSGLFFCYIILIPAALKFLIEYGSDIIEPIWSFEEYINFVLLLSFSTGMTFQIPVIQIILGSFNFVSSSQMLHYCKYVIFISSIIGAIITPSTDPLTQIFMSTAIIILYVTGIFILKTLKK